MKKHLRYIDDNSDKFWQIEVSGPEFKVAYGKTGTAGTSQSKKFENEILALKAAEKLVADKIKKGYSEDGTPAAPKPKPGQGSKKADQESLAAGYDAIIRSRLTSALVPFLKANAKGNVDFLKKQVKKNNKYWTEFQEIQTGTSVLGHRTSSWRQRGDEIQQELINLSALALFNKSDISSWPGVLDMLDKPEEPLTLEVLQWAKPSWLDDFILGQLRRQDWSRFSYKSLRFLEEQSLINFNPELAARCIAGASEWSSKMAEREYIAWITTDKTACERDVPLLFEYETSLHTQGFRDNETQDFNEFSAWAIIFETLLKDGKLDRAFFVEQAALIQTKDWNASLRSFFRKVLADMAPSAQELLAVQESLFACLHNPTPAVATFAVDQLKKIYEQPGFDTDAFLDWAEALMTRTDTKGAVKSVLGMLEKINKLHPERNAAITSLAANVFIIPDVTLQERAAKLLAKTGKAGDYELADKLEGFAPLMHSGARAMLDSLIGNAAAQEPETETYSYDPAPEKVLTEPVELPKDWNDILYLFGKFIASDEVLDTELLLNAFIMQRHLFPPDYSAQLEPYRKQLENTYFSSIHKSYMDVFLRQKIHSLILKLSIADDRYNKVKTLMTIKPLLYEADQRTRSKTLHPMLCMPSHKPHWIAPKTLLERLVARQEAGEASDPLDLVVAISRMPRENTEEALPLLEKLEGDMKGLMAYCLGISDTISLVKPGFFGKVLSKLGSPENLHKTGVWAVAARTYNPDGVFPEFEKSSLDSFPFVVQPFRPEVKVREAWNDIKNWQTGKMERSASWYELTFQVIGYRPAPGYLLYSLDQDGHKSGKYEYILGSAGNVAYWHSIMPQNAEPLALHLLQTACKTATGIDRELEGYLNAINSPGFRFSGTALLAYACAFFQEKKEQRLLAAEVLINLVERRKADPEALAVKLAWLAAQKYGPFLRMAESLLMLKDVSPLHNAVLFRITDGILANFGIPDKLPANFKKLVETYADVLYKTNSKPSAGAVAFLEKFSESGSLKSLIKQILK